MRFETEIRDGVCVVHLEGRFVTGSERELDSVNTQLDGIGVSGVVLDFEQVPYIDSTGLAFVVELHKAMRRRGGHAVIAQPNQRVREVLVLTRIAELVTIYDDLESAEMALRGEVLC